MATRKRPLGPSPGPIVTSSPAATTAVRRDQPRGPTSPSPTTTHITFLRMLVSHKVPLSPSLPRLISLAPLHLPHYAQLHPITTSMHSTMGTTISTPTRCQLTRVTISITMRHIKRATQLMKAAFKMQQITRINPPAHGNYLQEPKCW